MLRDFLIVGKDPNDIDPLAERKPTVVDTKDVTGPPVLRHLRGEAASAVDLRCFRPRAR
jgi:hypothetical protein